MLYDALMSLILLKLFFLWLSFSVLTENHLQLEGFFDIFTVIIYISVDVAEALGNVECSVYPEK